MLLILVSLVLALITGAITAWGAAHFDGIDREHLDRVVAVPTPWRDKAPDWLQTRADARLATAQSMLRLTLLVTAIAAFGWLMGIGLVVVSFVAGSMLGSRRDQPVVQAGHLLERAASIVRTNAQALRATGDGDQARAADEYAARIDFLRDIYGKLAPPMFAQLMMPSGLALLLENYFLPEGLIDAASQMPIEERRDPPPRRWGDLDIGFRNWLGDEILPLLSDPFERSRAERLERVRRELVAGGGTAYQDLGRLQQIVAELRRVA